jgi:predicted RNA-binding protein with PUA-like domain
MNHWLIKSEPFKWSWQQQVDAGDVGTHWDGVRNHLAKQQLMAMRLGDQAFFYHSNEGKEIVGIVKVIREYYPDPSDVKGQFGMVDVSAVQTLSRPVSLAQIKADPALQDMALVRLMRLSVQPVTPQEWEYVRALGGV